MPFSLFDLFMEPLVGRIRRCGLEIWPPRPGSRVLDVGCGTGTTLRLYQQAGCAVYGIDANPAMVAAARRKLGPEVEVRLGDAVHMPYSNGSFDLATATLALHEMQPRARAAVVSEMLRVLRPEGRAVLIDFRPDPSPGLAGRVVRGAILLIEALAGREHLRNGRDFVRTGGLPSLLAGRGPQVEAVRVAVAGQVGIYRLRARA